MSFSLHVNRDSDQPICRQIVEHIRGLIRDGQLPVDTQLPPIRRLAQVLGVTRLTVETAYNQLQADGWIESFVGRGTFVVSTACPRDQLERVGHEVTTQGFLEDMPRIMGIKTVSSFAYAEPDANLFLIDTFWPFLTRLQAEGKSIMQYGSPQGDIHLRVELAKLLRERGVEAAPSDFIVSTGVTQGLSLVTQALTSPGDTVIVEQPAHPAFLRIFEAYQVRPIPVRRDETGLDLDQLERIIIQYRPRFLCTIPAFHNPIGYSLTEPQRLMDLARKYNLLVVEDDIYGLLSYDGPPAPVLKAIDETDLVIYLSGFSKTMMPGLRTGFVHAPQPRFKHLVGLKQAIDLGAPALMQSALAQFIRLAHFKARLRRIVPIYAERRDHLIKKLPQYMPKGTQWTRPGGGFSCWLTLPPSSTVSRSSGQRCAGAWPSPLVNFS